jgi:hypothetical protein
MSFVDGAKGYSRDFRIFELSPKLVGNDDITDAGQGERRNEGSRTLKLNSIVNPSQVS